jgi:Fe-S cluster assembly protein SufD
MNLAMPPLKEGLSGSLDKTKIPDIHTHHENSRHEIEGACEVRKENGKIIITILPQNTKEDIIITSNYSLHGELDLEINVEKGSMASIHRIIKEQRTGNGEQNTEHRTPHSEHRTGMINEKITIHVKENARLTYNEEQNLNKKTSWHIQKKAEVAGTLHWYHHTTGGNLSIQEIHTLLTQEKAQTILLCTTNISEEQEHYSNAHIEHKALATQSTMHAKTVIGGKAKTLHKGLIIIHENAQESIGHQHEDTLITSNTAEANTLPELEINNQEVSCSHGASIGDIDEEQLFYLCSHGLNEETARALITTGFLKSITNHAHNEQWKENILTILQRGEEQ